jgi:hypothetical protein
MKLLVLKQPHTVSLFAWIFRGLKSRYKQKNHVTSEGMFVMSEGFDKTVKLVAYHFK